MSALGKSFTKSYHHKLYPAIDPSQPSLSAKGKVVWVTGGNQGIGAAIAEAFVTAQAAAVIITGRTESTLQQTRSKLEDHARSIKSDTVVDSFVNDIRDIQSVLEIVAAVKKRFGKLDILVNNAAVLPEVQSLVDSDVDKWWLTFDINVRGSYNVIKHFLSVANQDAIIINVTTFLAHISINGYSSYGPSKSALLKVLEHVQKEHPSIKVFNFSPGIVATAMNADGHAVTEDDVELPGAFAVWLASPEATFLAGRLVWANWDVAELKEKKDDIINKNLLVLDLIGWNRD
ncbi:hypothetical protein F5884DRAFT_736179 [Xylogone sp. PMI_703]|nr:hypothetical protein F5884DRAFT_736179 [Xylogone sp. PMI_703]